MKAQRGSIEKDESWSAELCGAGKDVLILEQNRLQTFVNWPHGEGARCNARKMAEAGFYACGGPTEADAAACFLCGKELDGWEETDDPWAEHKSHAPSCMFARLGLAEKEMTLANFLAVWNQYNVNRVMKSSTEQMETYDKLVKQIVTRTSKI